jgi:hypothetical protein
MICHCTNNENIEEKGWTQPDPNAKGSIKCGLNYGKDEAKEDARTIRLSMTACIGPDVKSVIDVIGNRNTNQRNMIRDEFKNVDRVLKIGTQDRSLIKDLDTFNCGYLSVSLCSEPAAYRGN